MPSMVALIDSNFGDMLTYYRMFSCDATWAGNIEIQPRDVHAVPVTSLEALLTAMVTQLRQGNKRLLVGIHGWPDGLPYPIVAGTSVSADTSFFNLAESAAKGEGEAKATLLTWQSPAKAKVFKTSAALDRLLAVIDEIRHTRITHLEFRGCNIAASGLLKAINSCLNAKYSVAPKVGFFSGLLHPPTDANTTPQLLTRIAALAPTKRVFTRLQCLLPFSSAMPDTDPGCALEWVRVSEHPTRYRGRFIAANLAAVEGWCKTMLEDSYYYPAGQRPAGGGFVRGRNLPIIGMWTPTGSKPFVFPGDSFDYLNTLGTEHGPS
ncbi:MAG: hypothetical protein NVSMB6_16450 [Burkholderiaceae bacterium]